MESSKKAAIWNKEYWTSKDWKERIPFYIMVVLISLIPVIMCGAIRLIYGPSLSHSIPMWNDEVWYWSQVESMVKQGAPLGYYGYNGSFATHGTFATWGMGILLPYVLFGKIFGWEYQSIAYANLTFTCLAIFLFIVITRMQKKNLGYMALTVFFSYFMMLYSFTAMAESFRIGYGVFLCALLYRLWNFETGKLYRYVFVPIAILFGMFTFVLHGLLIPVYLFAIMKKGKTVIKGIISFFTMAILSCAIYFINALSAAPYYEGQLQSILQQLQDNGMKGAIRYVIRLFLDNCALIDVFHIIEENNLYAMFKVVYYVLLIYFVVRFIKTRKQKSARDYFISVYLMLGYLVAYIVLYNVTEVTLVRGLNIALVGVMFWNVASEDKKPIWIHCGIFALGFFTYFALMSNFYTSRIASDDQLSQRESDRQEISQIIPISDQNSTWDNTINIYGADFTPGLIMPVGAGLNQNLDKAVCQDEAKWSVLHSDDELIGELEALGWSKVWEKNNITILGRK